MTQVERDLEESIGRKGGESRRQGGVGAGMGSEVGVHN